MTFTVAPEQQWQGNLRGLGPRTYLGGRSHPRGSSLHGERPSPEAANNIASSSSTTVKLRAARIDEGIALTIETPQREECLSRPGSCSMSRTAEF